MMMRMGPAGPTAHMVGKAQTTEQLAGMVGNDTRYRPVVDKTGLTGNTISSSSSRPTPAASACRLVAGPPPGAGPRTDANVTDPSGLTIVGALQQQLGLRLVSTKAPLDTLVIDHVEKCLPKTDCSDGTMSPGMQKRLLQVIALILVMTAALNAQSLCHLRHHLRRATARPRRVARTISPLTPIP